MNEKEFWTPQMVICMAIVIVATLSSTVLGVLAVINYFLLKL
jgi:hypothetical protein